MVIALILVSIAFAVTLGVLMFGNRAPSGVVHAPSLKSGSDAEPRLRQLESDLDKKRRELDEQKAQLGELKAELKTTKRKLYEQKESEKGDRDLVKAREEAERNATLQLVNVRADLANALAEVQRLRDATEIRGRRVSSSPSPLVASAPSPAATDAAPAPAPVVEARAQEERPRKFRELNDADREKMERLEHDAAKAKQKAVEVDRELKRTKGRAETAWRIVTQVRGEADLLRDKFKALEKRMNRILLERDLLRRAIKDLEKKAGVVAERTELTPDEIAASDQKVEDSHAQEAALHAEREAAAMKAAEAVSRAEENSAGPAAPETVALPSAETATANDEKTTAQA